MTNHSRSLLDGNKYSDCNVVLAIMLNAYLQTMQTSLQQLQTDCRPVADRSANHCRPLATEQIELVRPKQFGCLICCFISLLYIKYKTIIKQTTHRHILSSLGKTNDVSLIAIDGLPTPINQTSANISHHQQCNKQIYVAQQWMLFCLNGYHFVDHCRPSNYADRQLADHR